MTAQRIMEITAGEQLVDIYAMCAGFTGCERRGTIDGSEGGVDQYDRLRGCFCWTEDGYWHVRR